MFFRLVAKIFSCMGRKDLDDKVRSTGAVPAIVERNCISAASLAIGQRHSLGA
jgi:hypothetical protein